MNAVTDRRLFTETPVSRSWLDDDGIFVIEIKPGAVVTRERAEKDMELNRTMDMGGPIGVLIDVRGIRSIDREARQQYTAHHEGGHDVRATALVIKSVISRMVANFFIGFNRPDVPVKLFTSVDDARAWLKENLA